jgi:hypothetical protein
MYSYPWNPVDPWSNYIHNGINGKRNGKPEIDTSMHIIAKTKEPKDNKDLMFNL